MDNLNYVTPDALKDFNKLGTMNNTTQFNSQTPQQALNYDTKIQHQNSAAKDKNYVARPDQVPSVNLQKMGENQSSLMDRDSETQGN